MSKLFVSVLLILVSSLFVTAQRTYVKGHYSSTGVWVPGHSRPYYPGDIYRRQQPVVVVVPGARQQQPPTYSPQMPSTTDRSGSFVETLKAKEEAATTGLDFARKEAERIDKENREKTKKKQVAN